MTASIPRTLIVASILALAACGGREEPQAPAAPREDPRAVEGAQLYQQLRELGRTEQAVRAGRYVLDNFPQTRAAASVRESFAELEAKARNEAEANRLGALWTYHQVPEADGTTRTAMIHRQGDSTGADAEYGEQRVRLVLRRHAEWGQSVYLLVEDGDFRCGDPCSASIRFDGGEARDWEVSVSREGPLPALFIEDDAAFIEALAGARDVLIEAPMAAAPTRPLHFEVGGFEMARFDPTGT